MSGTGFLILFGLSCVLLSCEGQVKPPSNGTKLIFFTGSTVKIDWSYVGDISQVQLRKWFFESSDGSRAGELTVVFEDLDPGQKNFTLIPRFEIDKPAALVLKNVDKTYNGIYSFSIQKKSSFVADTSKVVVYIAAKPNVTFSCPSSVTLNEGDDFTCTCRGESGNPPANVTWFKDGVQIGGTGIENITLHLTNVDKNDRGTYKCVAESYPNPVFIDVKTVQVNFTTTDDGEDKGGLPTGAIIGIVIGVLALLAIIATVVCCCKSKEKDWGNRTNVDPVPVNHYELENEEPDGQRNTRCASLDTEANQSSRASEKESDGQPQTEYATIDFAKSS